MDRGVVDEVVDDGGKQGEHERTKQRDAQIVHSGDIDPLYRDTDPL